MVSLSGDIIVSPPPPSPAEIAQIASGDQKACEGFLGRWETPISMIARRYVARATDLDDLLQVGRLAVFRAAISYDPSLAVPFGNYAKRAIRNQVIKEALRLKDQRSLEVGTCDVYSGDAKRDERILDFVRLWLLELREPYSTIYRLLYIDGHRQRDAAGLMQLSQPRVAQLHAELLDAGRQSLAN